MCQGAKSLFSFQLIKFTVQTLLLMIFTVIVYLALRLIVTINIHEVKRFSKRLKHICKDLTGQLIKSKTNMIQKIMIILA